MPWPADDWKLNQYHFILPNSTFTQCTLPKIDSSSRQKISFGRHHRKIRAFYNVMVSYKWKCLFFLIKEIFNEMKRRAFVAIISKIRSVISLFWEYTLRYVLCWYYHCSHCISLVVHLSDTFESYNDTFSVCKHKKTISGIVSIKDFAFFKTRDADSTTFFSV